MNKFRTTLLVFVAGSACGTALAQVLLPAAPAVQQIFLKADGTPDTNPYADRAVGAVFNNGFALTPGALLNGVGLGFQHIMEDFDFTGGPWAPTGQPAPTGRRVTGFGFTVQHANCTGAVVFDAIVEIFAGTSANFTATNMTSPNGVPGTPLFTGRFALNGNCGFQALWTINLRPAGAPDQSFIWPDGVNTGFMRIRLVEPTTTTFRPNSDGFVYGTGAGSNAIGRLTANSGWDLNDNGADLPNSGLLGGTPPIVGVAAGHENRRTSGTLTTALRMLVNGEIAVQPPPSTIPLGNIANGVTTQNVTIPDNGVAWYSVNLGDVIGDPNQTFLDIDTEGTSGVPGTSIALFDNQGNLLTSDEEDGSGALSQLTFGFCRRPAVGDGRQYDGRDGDVVAGTYFIGVGVTGTAWAAGPAASSTSTGGSAVLNIRTNASANGPGTAPTPIQPNIDSGNDFGTLQPPGVQSAPIAAGPRDVTWYKFTIPGGTNATNFLDIDTVPTDLGTDTEIGLFNAAGVLVAEDDDDNDVNLSMLTFGASGSPRPANGAGLEFDGRDGNLPTGTYYLAVGLFNNFFQDGWCSRTNSGSNLDVQITINTNIAGSTCSGSCLADVDDGSGTGVPDGGVSIEDLLFYLTLFDTGVSCADVDDGSGTGTRDGGVSIEDLLYYLVRFDAGC